MPMPDGVFPILEVNQKIIFFSNSPSETFAKGPPEPTMCYGLGERRMGLLVTMSLPVTDDPHDIVVAVNVVVNQP